MKKLVLTIAGSDSGAGAGVQADARTIQALGGYALTAITAVTAQNTRGIAQWQAVSPRLIAAQITVVLEDFSVGAVKTGLLPGAAAVRAVAKGLRRRPRLPLVVDPVLGSTSGTRFLGATGLVALKRELLPRAALVTPNWPEAAALAGMPVRTEADVETAARKILALGCGAVLVKGGHAPGRVCPDYLLRATGAGAKGKWFRSARVATRNTHGTGCVLSAAIAAGLARGETIERAVAEARKFLRKGLVAGRKLRLGKGRGAAFAG